MKKETKYNYYRVIQQYYTGSYGWEDVSSYDTKLKDELNALPKDLKEYRLLGYPTRVINRRELKTNQ